MEAALLETPRDALEMMLHLKKDEKVLIIKTISGCPIIMKYKNNKTPVKNIYECLKNKVKYAFGGGGEYKTSDDFVLNYRKKNLKRNNRDISSFGITRDCEILYLIKNEKGRGSASDPLSNEEINNIVTKYMRRRRRAGSAQIFIKTLSGHTITLDVPEDVSAEEIQCGVRQRESIPIDQQRMIYAGYELEGKTKLIDRMDEPSINEATLYIVLRLRGGMYS